MSRPPTLFCCHPPVWKSQDHYFRALSMFWVAFIPLLVLPSPGVPLTAPIGATSFVSKIQHISVPTNFDRLWFTFLGVGTATAFLNFFCAGTINSIGSIKGGR